MSAPTHYASSKGPKPIADMPYPYALNARDKLVRERRDDSRDAEIAALTAHIDAIDAIDAMAHEEAEI